MNRTLATAFVCLLTNALGCSGELDSRTNADAGPTNDGAWRGGEDGPSDGPLGVDTTPLFDGSFGDLNVPFSLDGSIDAGPLTGWTLQSSATTQDLAGIWGSGSTDVYAVGTSGTILHSTGGGVWSVQTSGTTQDLQAVGGSGSGDVYAVGISGTILHSTGNGVWTNQTSGTASDLNGVWADGIDVYVVGAGEDGVILHSTGDGAWTAEVDDPDDGIWAVWGSGSGDVYALDVTGILHSTGNGQWAHELNGIGFSGTGLWGSGIGDVYSVGGSGIYQAPTILHSTGGGAWAEQPMADGNVVLSAGFSNSTTDAYLLGEDLLSSLTVTPTIVFHTTGDGVWTALGETSWTLTGIWASGPSDVYAVGNAGSVLHNP